MKRILGISAFYHDSAAALIEGNKIIAAAQEERFTRDKHSPEFPVEAITYCLKEGGLDLDDLDAVVFYDKPLLKFERLLQTYYAFSPGGILSFLKAIPVWINEKIFLKRLIYQGLKEVGPYEKKRLKLLFSEHHLSHAASAFYPSHFKKSAILTIDGVGEWCTAAIAMGENNKITILKEMEFPHSVGLLYSAFTYYLGFKVNSGEYKLMGLAPYGNPGAEETSRFVELITSHLVDIKEDGSVWLNQSFFNYATGLRMVKDKKWEALFGFPRRKEKDELQQHHCNLAFAIQSITEEIVLKMAIETKKRTQADYLCMAGGVALNCVANGKLMRKNIFKEVYIQPAAGDAGGALGAALAANYLHFNQSRVVGDNDQMQGAYLGPAYSDKEIEQMARKVTAVYHKFEDFKALLEEISDKLVQGDVVGWFQGRMEFGPRALGNRSILGDPRKADMHRKINLQIKQREEFRPFAPSVLAENTSDYFELESASPYMLTVAPVIENRRKKLPGNYYGLTLQERLSVNLSDIPSVTHVDYSSRIQTVHRSTNSRYWELINSFKEKTGCAVLINTSFNIRGEPIVCSPYHAYRCFMSSEMDHLVIGDFLFHKTEQPDWQNKDVWKIDFKKD